MSGVRRTVRVGDVLETTIDRTALVKYTIQVRAAVDGRWTSNWTEVIIPGE